MTIYKKTERTLLTAFFLSSAVHVSAGALPFNGTDITIYDGQGSGTGWYGAQEDQEVESNSVGSQAWDLEGFFMQDTGAVAMVGGFDFVNGVAGYRGGTEKDYRSGDIFIDANNSRTLTGSEEAPAGQATVQDTFGYEYAFDIDWGTLTYDLIALDQGTTYTQLADLNAHYGSSPWKYSSGGTVVQSGLSFSAASGLSDSDSGFVGGSHYAAYGFDIAFLNGKNAVYHFTMGCGNDNLMGMGAFEPQEAPEPAAFALFALLGGGLFAARRRAALKR